MRTHTIWPTEFANPNTHTIRPYFHLRCRQTCKNFNQAIKESLLIQYHIQLATNGMVDGSAAAQGMNTVAKRLEALQAYHQAWMTLTPRILRRYLGRYESSRPSLDRADSIHSERHRDEAIIAPERYHCSDKIYGC